MENKISVIINTYNASQHLRRVLEALTGFDEIVVCDMESTDNTRDIAAEFGCRIVNFPKGDHTICEPARDFAIHSATYPWVLVVDADEIVPKGLREHLYKAIADSTFEDAFAVPRTNRFMGESFKENTDYQLRFFLKDRATWPPFVHSQPKIDGKIVRIPPRKELCLQHLDDPTIAKRIDKLNTYTDNEVVRRATKHFGLFSLFFRPVWFFIRTYFFKGGIRHGRKGIVKSYFSAIYQMVLMAKIMERQECDK